MVRGGSVGGQEPPSDVRPTLLADRPASRPQSTQVSGRANRTRGPGAGPGAQAPGERRRLQRRAPASLRELGRERGRPGEPAHFLRQLFPRHHAAVERGRDAFRQAIEIFERYPKPPPERGALIPPTRAEGRVPEGQLACGKQVQRAPHGPGLHERAVLPQRARNGFPVEAFDPGPHGQLGQEDITCACRPHRRLATASRLPAGARWSRRWRRTRQGGPLAAS